MSYIQNPYNQSQYLLNLQLANSCLARHDYGSLIQNEDLFLAIAHKIIKDNIAYEHLYSPKIQTAIKDLREIFARKFLTKENFSVAAIFQQVIVFKEDASIIDVSIEEKHDITAHDEMGSPITFSSRCDGDHYLKYMKDCIPKIAAHCGASAVIIKERRLIHSAISHFERPIDIIQVIWDERAFRPYPTPPATIPEIPCQTTVDYNLYLEGIGCDWSLTSEEGIPIPVHGLVLARNPFLRIMFTTKMKEATEKTIRLPYSTRILLLFIEYLYLGEPRISNQEDSFALLDIAHIYDIAHLKAYCTNTILLSASDSVAQDAGFLNNLLEIATTYGNEKLLELYAHLTSSPAI